MDKFSLKSIVTNEFDYNLLMSYLKDYNQPWSKIRNLQLNKEIIRVKKGLYIKNPTEWGPFSNSILANLIYGPSYISREFALSYYGLIPERVPLVTSVTLKPTKKFNTPVGYFDYKHLSQERYAYGFTRVGLDEHRFYLMATPEKALVDTIMDKDLDTPSKLQEYLEHDLRIDLDEIKKLNSKHLQALALRFRRPIVRALATLNKELKE
jgi:predicted transcriptional regulator of viral defense system